MNYKSIATPVLAEQVKTLQSEKLKSYVEFFSMVDGEVATSSTKLVELKCRLKKQYGATEIEATDWIVEFPNGEVHVVRDERFSQRFQRVEAYTPEEVKNAISMAKLLATMGGESS